MTKYMDVVILDGNQRSALAVTRSLGSRGIKVIVGENGNPSLSSSSKYSHHSLTYPSPFRTPETFLLFFKEYLKDKSNSVLLPMTDVTLSVILANKSYLGNGVKIPCVDYNKFMMATNKISLFRLAQELNIPVPETLFSPDFKDTKLLIDRARVFGFPVVVKPAHSRICTENGWINAGVKYARDVNELRIILNSEPFLNHPFLIQERIIGPGIGVFLLMQDRKVIARFAHKRKREKPPSGGVSVLCESIEPPPAALESAIKLLNKLDLFGVAMVEFKLDKRDNLPKLMEVNARFWGSLQLAISAGVDFPYLLYCIAIGQKVNPSNNYRIGLKLRWELGDLDHLLVRIKKRNSELYLPNDAPSRPSVIKEFIFDFFRLSVKNEVFRPDDPGPFIFELKQYIRNLRTPKR